MKPRRCKYCGVLLYRWSPNCGGICGSPECRRKWDADDQGRSWMRHALESIRDEKRDRMERGRQAQETIDAFRADIEAMRAGQGHGGGGVPGGIAGDDRRQEWARRLREWREKRPAPTPWHCPVCGMKTKPGRTWCSDPCANEAAHWEAVAAWLAGTGPDPTKQTKQEGAR
ncbi:hypothetical protein [Pseudoscardovia suis]|uniref:Uncharacterized protein n=1 Tax=Pseudoscardovia suis TaxID=987063 RepID=A0A261F0Z0_9BIFI|nr:hypothetical protein [Pseudoscardovia suis]OZG52789.1 hypothetical protein PSSU_0407 [Pseudoscardovia suis]PJJ64964.1 hypothetical protein CLV65_1516 [Pseudoscardovia suis]